MKTYQSLAALKAKLAIPTATTDRDDALALALVVGTRVVDEAIGDLDIAADDHWTGSSDDLVVATTPDAALVAATEVFAVRFFKSADVPFGVAGMNDAGVVAYVRSSVPEAEIMLAGKRVSWGIA